MNRVRDKIATPLRALALLALASCGSRISGPLEVAPSPDAQTTDVTLWLAKHEHQPDGSQHLAAQGTCDGQPVGFELLLGPWRENPPGFIDMKTWDCKATLRSTGAPSDAWIRFLARLYGTAGNPGGMPKEIELQALSPWKDPGGMKDGPAKFLLLFPPSFDYDRSAEVRIEVDSERGRFVWKEKDRALRQAVMAALATAS